MAHSPGPWKAVRYGQYVSKRSYSVYAESGEAITGWGCVLQTEANAVLIATAPSLLALVEAVEWVEDGDSLHQYCPWCGEYENYGHAPDCERQRALDQARRGGGAEEGE